MSDALQFFLFQPFQQQQLPMLPTNSTSPVPNLKYQPASKQKPRFDHHLPNIWLVGHGMQRPDAN